MQTLTFAQVLSAGATWKAPYNLLGQPSVYVWGPGGTGATGLSGTHSGGGGGSGSLGGEPALGSVGPGTVLTFNFAAGGSGTAATVTGGAVTVTGNPGGSPTGTTAGAAGTAPANTVSQAGAAGGAGVSASSRGGGGGGGAPGLTAVLAAAAGTAGSTGGVSTGGNGGPGGGAAPYAGGAGGKGGFTAAAVAGTAPGGGGGGGGDNTSQAGAAGGNSQALIIWSVWVLPTYSRGIASAVRGRAASSTGAPVLQVGAAPFAVPSRAPRGAPPAARGRAASSPGAPVVPVIQTVWNGTGGSTLASDPGGYTLNMEAKLTAPGTLAGIRFYSPPGASVLPAQCALFDVNSKTIIAGTLNTAPSWSGAPGTGWVRCAYNQSVILAAGQRFKVAVFYPGGSNWYSFTSHYFDTGPGNNGVVSGIITVPNNAVADNGQDSFINSGAGIQYPTGSFNATNYWIDVEIGIFTPAPFAVPPRAPRGEPGAGRGRAASSSGAPVVPTPPVPAPFAVPPRAPRGRPGAGRGRAARSSGAPVVPTPAPFKVPARAVRGTRTSRRGRAASSSGAPRTAPPAPKTLLISLASAAGTDDYGTAYPQGILATAGVIEGPEFIGTDFIINTSGYFSYSGTPAAGNLISSVAPADGADSFRNNYVAGTASYSASLATALTAGAVTTYTGSLFFGWTAKAVIQTNSFGDLILEASSGRQVITVNNILDDGAGGASFQSAVTVGGANLNVGNGASGNINLNPPMATPPNYPLSGSSTTAQIAAFCNAIKDSLHNRGMMT